MENKIKLIVGPGLKDPVGNDAFLVKALKKHADVVTFDGNEEYFEDVLKSLPIGWEPDAIIVRDAEYYRIPQGIENAPYPIFGLIGDYNLNLNRMLPIMGIFDYFFCDTLGVKIFKKLGFDNCEFFCLYAHDKEVHRDYGESKVYDVVFVGNMNFHIQKQRERAIYELAKLKDKYGILITTGIYNEDYAKLLNSSVAVLNYPIRNEVNMRFFEAMACGSILIQPNIEEASMLGFNIDSHYIELSPHASEFSNIDDAIRLTKTSDYIDRIRENVKNTLEYHTYDIRALQLIDTIKYINIDISKRRTNKISRQDMSIRWQLFSSNNISVCEISDNMPRFHPMILGWARELINNDLEINNMDFMMWYWWIDLLYSSGLKTHALKFMIEKESFLGAFGCYDNQRRRLSKQINQIIHGFNI